MPHFSSCFHFCQFTPGEIEASLITLRLLKLILVCNIKSFAWTSRNREVLRCHLREERVKKKKEKNLGSGCGGSCLCWDVSFEACYVTWVQPHKSSAHFCILENPFVWHHPKRKKCLSRLKLENGSWRTSCTGCFPLGSDKRAVETKCLSDSRKFLWSSKTSRLKER